MKPFYSPILNELVHHAESLQAGFHVPGHRYGQALKQELLDSVSGAYPSKWFSAIMELDVTELSSTDDLHHPEASIKEAQQLAAKTFGAEESFFLVGGSTSGNVAMLLALCKPGDIIIVQRNVHKSIINGLRLAGASAVFLTPIINEYTGLATIPTLHQVEEALRLYPEAKGVYLSNPNYYGMTAGLAPYAELVHRYDRPLIVDEAHGAHFGLHKKLPKSALAGGADAVVQSTHKTLTALTMGAMLHVQGDRIDRESVRESLAMIQSSSPSFPIMASLDISRAMIDALGGKLFEQSLEAAEAFRMWLKESSTFIKEADTYDANRDKNGFTGCADPLRIVICDSSGRLSGFELQRYLESYGCYPEMADNRYVVLVLGIQASMEDMKKLQSALEAIQHTSAGWTPAHMGALHERSRMQQLVSEPISFARDRYKHLNIIRVEIEQAEGLLSAEMVIPYPPGIAILYPGEKITEEIISEIKQLSAFGAKFQGAADSSMATLAVYAE